MATDQPPPKRFKQQDGRAIAQSMNTVENFNTLTGKIEEEGQKNTPKPNADFKYRSYQIILVSWHLVGAALGLPDDAQNDLVVSCEISSLISAGLKMETQVKGGFKDRNESKESTVTYKGKAYVISNKLLREICQAVYNFYKPAGDSKGFVGCLQPLQYYTQLFKDRMKCYRVTTTYKTVKKENGKEQRMALNKFGVKPAHVVFSDGLKLPPHIVSSMAQAVGPIQVLFSLVHTEEQYSKKWQNAAEKQFGHIPGMKAAIAYIKGRRSEDVRPIITLMLDVLLLLTPRQSHKAAIPACMLAYVFCEDVKFSKIREMSSVPDAKLAEDIGALLELREQLVHAFNSSGPQLGAFLNKIFEKKWTVPDCGSEKFARTMTLISLLGAGKEDLSILTWMFGGTEFSKRSDMGSAFQGQGKKETSCTLTLPTIKFWSRMAQSSMSGLQTASGSQQISSVSVLAGKRNKFYSKELCDYLEEGESTTESFHVGKEGAITTLQNVKKKALEKIKNQTAVQIGGTVGWGTPVPWEFVVERAVTVDMDIDGDETTAAEKYLIPTTLIPTESGRYFFA